MKLLPIVTFSLLIFGIGSARAAEGDAFLWESRPYRVSVALDGDFGHLSPDRMAAIAEAVQLRLDRRVRPFWSVSVQTPASADDETDKRLQVSLTGAVGGGYRVSATDHDLTLGVTGPAAVRFAESPSSLPETLVDAAMAAFRPVARYDRKPDDPSQVRLAYRGADLVGAIEGARRSQLLTPFLVRRRESEAPTATRASWTYLLVDREDPESARVVSHTRRPFRQGRRGRVERLAIVTSQPQVNATTVLRLHAHNDPKTPLPGYEVLVGKLDGPPPVSVGFTNRAGEQPLAASGPLAWATVRCGEVTVAMTPFAPGVDRELVLPLLDERPRLRAEATLSALREELIDTVARKKILAGRVRKAIAEERIADARRDLDSIESLPGPTAFARRIDAAERSSSAEHPIAQQRLEKLFANTRTVLSKALDPRETRELAIAVDRAEQRSSGG